MYKRKKDDDEDDEYYDSGGDADDDFIVPDEGTNPRKRGRGGQAKGKRFGGAKGKGSYYEESAGLQDYSRTLKLKSDHEKRPIWITKDNLIILEAFSPLYQQAYDFLVAIAEPESRPEFIHTYRLTENSLYAAVSISIDTESIIKVLNRLCKTDVPSEVIEYIRDCTITFGKAKLVLKDNKFYVESQSADVLRQLLENPTIRSARVLEIDSSTNTLGNSADGFQQSSAPEEDLRNLEYAKLGTEEIGDDDEDDDEDISEEMIGNGIFGKKQRLHTVSFMIEQKSVQIVKRSAKEESKYPLMEEYDFKNDHKNPLLPMDLRASTKIRPYQEKSLSKMFGNGRARSGIIVLPCGAGKSLTGVTAASTIKRSCIVICINNASVKQWKEQFVMWTNLPEKSVKIFTSVEKEDLPPPSEACVVISSYSMISHGKRRSASGEAMIQSVREREWGLMILDEVHVAPAAMFQNVLSVVNAHCKLGLTATLVREDDKIKDLHFLVGPKLYEANWIDLTNQGFLARVQCVEVWCPMTKEFYAEYISKSIGANSRVQRLLYTLNPRKFRACEYLVKYHAKRGDKIIIFSDDVPALVLYCEALKPVLEVMYLYGGTKESERRTILAAFKTRAEVSCIGLSKIGDTALDIPEANVIIQVSSHFGARRQEAQRLGRILRPKPNPTGGFNAFFYTLVSTDTKEMYFSTKRQQYLVDQGYTFKVVQDLVDKADKESSLLTTVTQELNLLNKVLAFNYQAYDEAEDKEFKKVTSGETEEDGGESRVAVARRTQNTLSSLSGAGGGQLYSEYSTK